VSPGEFVLGYPDEDGLVADAPAEPLRTGGTFMVLRKLYQDVGAFRSYLREAAATNGMSEELLAAKLVGRWRSGAPLALAPDRDDPRFAMKKRLNDFRYSTDPDGMRCPLGAHIRRANPRDALGWRGVLTKRHRIIRRGMPYGPRFEDRPEADRGLMFVCYQASIARQFEFVQSLWLGDGDPFGLGSERDPLLGGDGTGGKVTIQGEPPTFLASLPSFVTTRGGDYFFAPGIRALHALADGELG
jgi:Dyp-type peroxidase family